MTEEHVNFLVKASFAVSQIESNQTRQILKSYYLLKSNQLTRGSGLPQKHFSEETRCTHCFMEWKKGIKATLKPIKLSKKQRRRIRLKAKIRLKRKSNKISLNKEHLLHSNILEKICSFCSHQTKKIVFKPSKSHTPIIEDKNKAVEGTKVEERQIDKVTKPNNKKLYQSSVYCDSKVAFSLSKMKNTLPSVNKNPQKIIKNNKKKKDKYAGLCQAAVISSMKIKEMKDKQNKLNFFLKPAA